MNITKLKEIVYQQEWRAKRSNYHREYYKNHRIEYFKNYWLKNKEEISKKKKDYEHKKRGDLLSFLGGKCNYCGFNNPKALQIDHINGGGSKERITMGYAKYRLFLTKLMKTNPDGLKNKFQLLCANCNCIKGA